MIDPALLEALDQITKGPAYTIEMPAPRVMEKTPRVRLLAGNTIALVAAPKAVDGGAKLGRHRNPDDGISLEDYRKIVGDLREKLENEVPKVPGYEIKVLDRYEDPRAQFDSFFGNSDFARDAAASLSRDANGYAYHGHLARGGYGCLVVGFGRDLDIDRMLSNQTHNIRVDRSGVDDLWFHAFFADHEVMHCLTATDPGMPEIMKLVSAEEIADAFAALRAIQKGAPRELVQVVALMREHVEMLGSPGDTHFSSHILNRILENWDRLASSERFMKLDLAGLAGLAKDIQAKYGLRKNELIHKLDMRDGMRKAGFDGRRPLDDLRKHSGLVPEFERILKVVDALESGKREIGTFKVDERRTMAGLRKLRKQGIEFGRVLYRNMTDGKVVKPAAGELRSAEGLSRPVTLAEVLKAPEGSITLANSSGSNSPIKASNEGVDDGHIATLDPVVIAPRGVDGIDTLGPSAAADPLSRVEHRVSADAPVPGSFDVLSRLPILASMPGLLSTTRMPDLNGTTFLADNITGLGFGPMDTATAALSEQGPQLNGDAFLGIDRVLDEARYLEFGPFSASKGFVRQIADAANDTGQDPAYLLAKCAQESSLGKNQVAQTSSGRGPFQFLEGTWLAMMKKYGAKYGYAVEAAQIRVHKGRLHVPDLQARRHIMNLRYNVYLSAAMAGEMAKADREAVEKVLGRPLTESETYLTHVMGRQGALRLLRLFDVAPKENAAKAFPREARANKGLFYDRVGKELRPVSIATLHSRMTGKIEKLHRHFAGVLKILDEPAVAFGESNDNDQLSTMDNIHGRVANFISALRGEHSGSPPPGIPASGRR